MQKRAKLLGWGGTRCGEDMWRNAVCAHEPYQRGRVGIVLTRREHRVGCLRREHGIGCFRTPIGLVTQGGCCRPRGRRILDGAPRFPKRVPAGPATHLKIDRGAAPHAPVLRQGAAASPGAETARAVRESTAGKAAAAAAGRRVQRERVSLCA